MFLDQFQTVENVIEEFETIEDIVDPVYPIVFHLIFPKTV